MERHADFAAAKAMLAKAKRILISGHLSPDGDAVGSMVAMMKLLRAAGYDAVATADPNSFGKMAFIPGTEDILPTKKLKRQKKFDLFLALDCSDYHRLPPEARPYAEKLPRLCIDHHVTNDGTFADVTVLDPKAASTTEMIWRFAKWNEWTFDRDIAEALWTGLVTDSGRFAYDSTRSGTLRAASDLLKYGVRTSEINDIIFGSFSRRAIKLKQIAWRKLNIWKNGRVAEVTLTRDDFRSVRGTKADAEDTMEIPRSVAHNEIALFFYEIPDRTHEVRCSIRTRGAWDATVLAKRFGGGGHIRAAGCTIKASLGVAKRQMRAAVKEMMKRP